MDIHVLESFKQIIDEANKNQTKVLQDIINDVKTEINEIKNTINQEIKKRKEIEEKYKELKVKYDTLDKQTRKNNIVIFGLKYNPNKNIKNAEAKKNLLEFTLKELRRLLGVQINPTEVNDIFSIGNQDTNKPVLVKFCSLLKKQEILSNCNKLKGTEVIISEDLNPEEREINKTLYKHLKVARQTNNLAYIRGAKLYINKKPYSLEELNKLEKSEVKLKENTVDGDLEAIDEESEEEEDIIEQKVDNKQSAIKTTAKKVRGSSRVVSKKFKKK